ncbi:MAG: hypothetical protein R2867_17495 [Caldilineaceae bacterium]
MNRRIFLKTFGGAAAGALALHQWSEAEIARAAPGQIRYQANDFTDWEVALGDGLYTALNQPPVTTSDIATAHLGKHSELRANTAMRGIMAHNITFKRIIDEQAFAYTHLCDYEFRLPFMPSTVSWPSNAQTLEASFFVWDGVQSRLDHGMAFQWVLNPWLSSFGVIRTWTNSNGGEWHDAGYLAPNTEWHKMQMVVDYQQRSTAMIIDGYPFPSSFATTPKPDTWDHHIAARLAAEIISLYPGNNDTAPMHMAEFRNWRWIWLPQ